MPEKSYVVPNSGTVIGDPSKVPVPVVGPLVSILIPCCGMLEYTKLLVPSILRHTRPPFELIFIDIGSLDGTVDYLAGVATVHSMTRVEVVRTPTDLGIQEACKEALAKAEAKGVRFLLPIDHVLANKFATDAKTQLFEGDGPFPADWMGLDIGPKTVELFSKEIADASTIVWNGPMGVFEMPAFAVGTTKIAKAVAENQDAISIVGGGDSVSAVNKAGVAEKITHISTGGGASLEFLEGKKLPGVEALTDK